MEKMTFVALYRWRLVPGQEAQFIAAWESMTLQLKAQRGALGSRLHRAEDGTWVAYAQWPDRITWEGVGALGSVDVEASKQMKAAIAESLPTLFLEPMKDLLTFPET